MFSLAHKVELTHVAYRGATPAFQDVITGRVPMTFATLSGALPLARDGKLRALAVCGPQRVEALPGVPTLGEIGLAIADTSPWYGFIGPAGMPPALVQRISDDIGLALRDAAVQARLAPFGADYSPSTPAGMAAVIQADRERWGPVIRDARITAT